MRGNRFVPGQAANKDVDDIMHGGYCGLPGGDVSIAPPVLSFKYFYGSVFVQERHLVSLNERSTTWWARFHELKVEVPLGAE